MLCLTCAQRRRFAAISGDEVVLIVDDGHRLAGVSRTSNKCGNEYECGNQLGLHKGSYVLSNQILLEAF